MRPDPARRLWRWHDDDRGFTLTELIVAMMVFAIAMVMIMGATISVLRVTKDAEGAASASFNTRQALAVMDRQVRSGNVLFSPSDEVGYLSVTCKQPTSVDGTPVTWAPDSGLCMRIFTQSNGDEKCVQWSIVVNPDASGTYRLQMRSWRADWQSTGVVGDWGVMANDLVLDPAHAPFTLVMAKPGDPYSARRLDIHLVALNEASGHDVTIDGSVSGRNTTYGYSGAQCLPVPPESTP